MYCEKCIQCHTQRTSSLLPEGLGSRRHVAHVDETLALLAGAKMFSKLDANNGVWEVPLAELRRHLTTFIMPFGQYCFNKLPFGIPSAPEFFQKQMSAILEGLPGVLCHLGDLLVFGKDCQDHDAHLQTVLE